MSRFDDRRCAKCNFWSPNGSRGEKSPGFGECRYSPPATGAWPVTSGDDWCGQFMPATTLPNWPEMETKRA